MTLAVADVLSEVAAVLANTPPPPVIASEAPLRRAHADACLHEALRLVSLMRGASLCAWQLGPAARRSCMRACMRALRGGDTNAAAHFRALVGSADAKLNSRLLVEHASFVAAEDRAAAAAFDDCLAIRHLLARDDVASARALLVGVSPPSADAQEVFVSNLRRLRRSIDVDTAAAFVVCVTHESVLGSVLYEACRIAVRYGDERYSEWMARLARVDPSRAVAVIKTCLRHGREAFAREVMALVDARCNMDYFRWQVVMSGSRLALKFLGDDELIAPSALFATNAIEHAHPDVFRVLARHFDAAMVFAEWTATLSMRAAWYTVKPRQSTETNAFALVSWGALRCLQDDRVYAVEHLMFAAIAAPRIMKAILPDAARFVSRAAGMGAMREVLGRYDADTRVAYEFGIELLKEAGIELPRPRDLNSASPALLDPSRCLLMKVPNTVRDAEWRLALYGETKAQVRSAGWLIGSTEETARWALDDGTVTPHFDHFEMYCPDVVCVVGERMDLTEAPRMLEHGEHRDERCDILGRYFHSQGEHSKDISRLSPEVKRYAHLLTFADVRALVRAAMRQRNTDMLELLVSCVKGCTVQKVRDYIRVFFTGLLEPRVDRWLAHRGA